MLKLVSTAAPAVVYFFVLKLKKKLDLINYSASETEVKCDDVNKDDKGDWGERGDRATRL